MINDNTEKMGKTNQVDRHVGERLRLARDLKGLSQFELAERLAIAVQQLAKYELGINRLSPQLMFEASRALSLTPSWFFEDLSAVPQSSLTEISNVETARIIEIKELFSGIPNAGRRSEVLDELQLLVESPVNNSNANRR